MYTERTLIRCIFKYKGKKYDIEDIMPHCLEKESVLFLYEYGNCSDDIYRASLIRIRYGDDEIPKLTEGSNEIELVDIDINCN